jgi:replicative DNA helicase
MRPPHDRIAEAAVLAAIALKPALAGDAFARLPDDFAFFDPRHQAIAAALRDMIRPGTPAHDIDAVTVGRRIEQLGLLGAFSGRGPARDVFAEFWEAMLQAVPGVAAADEYVGIVHGLWVRRDTVRKLTEAAEAAADEKQPLPDTLLRVQQDTVKLAGDAADRRVVSLGEAGADLLEVVSIKAAERERMAGRMMGLPTGIPDLDALMGYIGSESFFLIGGDPSKGKSTLLLRMAEAVANSAPERRDDGRGGALFISLEMRTTDLAGKILYGAARLDSRRVRHGDISEDEMQRLTEAQYQTRNTKLYIDELLNGAWPQVRSRIILSVAEYGVDAVFIDYIQNISQDKKDKFQKRNEHFTEVSKAVKSLTRELKLPMICAARLKRAEGRSRKADKRPHRPELRDLGETSSLEFDADDVVLIWPGLKPIDGTVEARPGNCERVPTTLILAKSRLGATGDVEVVFNKTLGSFEPRYAAAEMTFRGATPTPGVSLGMQPEDEKD